MVKDGIWQFWPLYMGGTNSCSLCWQCLPVGPTLKTHRHPIHGEKPWATTTKPNPHPAEPQHPSSSPALQLWTLHQHQSRTGGSGGITAPGLHCRQQQQLLQKLLEQRQARTGGAPQSLQQRCVCPTMNIKSQS